MILGVGCDIIRQERVKKACEREHFLERYYSSAEQELIARKSSRCATNFAGKEAVAKALGTGFSHISPLEIEILREDKGKPYVRLLGNAKKIAEEMGILHLHISLSDDGEYAQAYAVAEG